MSLERILFGAGKVVVAIVGLFLLTLLPEPYLHARAKPPAQVTNAVSFLEWQPKPLHVLRVTVGTNTYLQALGPAGRFMASGPSAYSFDSSGKFIGWTPDNGDIFRPPHLYGPGVTRETATISDLKAVAEPVRQ